MRRIFKVNVAVVLLLSLMLGGCSGKPKAQPDPTEDNYRAFYQIFVGSFSDSDGDGTGDLRGIINRMDYLNDGNMYSEDSLGIQGIWLPRSLNLRLTTSMTQLIITKSMKTTEQRQI